MGTNNPGPLQPMTSQEAEGNQPKPDTRVGVEAGVGGSPQDPDLHGSQALLQARRARQGGGRGPWRLVGGPLLPAIHKFSHIFRQLPCRGELA